MNTRVLKEDELFLVSDPQGDILSGGEQGLYADDTRYLSRLELLVAGQRPQLLAYSDALTYEARIYLVGQGEIPAAIPEQPAQPAAAGEGGDAGPPWAMARTPLVVERRRFLYAGALYEELSLTHHGPAPARTTVTLHFAADFRDLFEVRGMARARRGETLPAEVGDNCVCLGYRGLDGVVRRVRLQWAPEPSTLTAGMAVFALGLAPGETVRLLLRAEVEGAAPAAHSSARAALAASYRSWTEGCTAIVTENPAVNAVLARGLADLRLLLTDLGHGPFPAAGVPWFVAPFGRDAALTALSALLWTPDLALGTLRTLAALQGQHLNPAREEAPGKIPHEVRQGEMAALGEVPFGRYYGSVDATLLFLVLYAEIFAWTGDEALARELLPAVERALAWLDDHADLDGDGLVEFMPAGGGLTIQSWKDSWDSVSHRDGTLARPPLAVVEVQGYAYDARRRLAPLLRRLGQPERAERLEAAAQVLRQQFERTFWMEDRAFYALALDGEKRQVGAVASDPGHCLWSGLVAPERARAVAGRLLAPDMFTGWGIRTLSAGERRYNPVSYHNGSVWPHDTALIALGLKRYGLDAEAALLAQAMLQAAAGLPGARLPELFCGFPREEGEAPVPYPAACSPQAWAAAAPAMLLRVVLGLFPDAGNRRLWLRPHLPPGLGRVEVHGLQIGRARVTLAASGEGEGTRWEVLSVQGELTVAALPATEQGDLP